MTETTKHEGLSRRMLLQAGSLAAMGVGLESVHAAGAAAAGGSAQFAKTWKSVSVKHPGFTDLGHYVIELPDYTDPSAQPRGIAAVNAATDKGALSAGGCTAMVKRNSRGEVIFGRNMDLDISQRPAYVYRTACGKYRNFCVTYLPTFYERYDAVQKMDAIDKSIQDAIPYLATDCMNEKGLYIETNLREPDERLVSYGLHSSHGEKTRADGTPWLKLRACTLSVPQLVSQNCATVQEALEYINNSFDWYAMAPAPGFEHNMCFLIGDATGEYGLIEIAQDQVSFLPYQYGQANFYITPKWAALETNGAGMGRLAKVSEVIRPVQTLEQAMDAMKPIMWRNETLWIGETERAADGKNRHPYNQIVFQDDKGNRQLDWRGEYVGLWPVLDDGRLVVSAQQYQEAVKSTYDPKIRKFIDQAAACGSLVIDDGSLRFNAGGRQATLSELAGAAESADPKQAALAKEYSRLRRNQNALWSHDDHNFEAMKAMAYHRLHVRYDDSGLFNPSAMSKYEKLIAFYGYGVPKDEKPLREDGGIWTTSLNVGVNCARREMKVRFWENDELIYSARF